MMLDKKALDMLLSLDDARLTMVIAKIASDAGLDASNLRIGSAELAGLRSALSIATESDLARAAELIKNYKSGKKNG